MPLKSVIGRWSARAAREAAKYGQVNFVTLPQSNFTTIPNKNIWNLDPNASFVYYCDNETIDGILLD